MKVYKQGDRVTGLSPAGFLQAAGARFYGPEAADVIRVDGGALEGPWICGVWGTAPSEFDLDYAVSEFATLLEGRIQVTDGTGSAELRAGDSFFVPKGSTVRWKVLEKVVKCFFIVPA
jgi:uncharacterized cupin superfamily protein